MAGPRTLDADRMSTTDLVQEALFLALRIRQSPEAKASLALAESLLVQARAGLSLEDKLREKLTEAEAGISMRNLDLDFVVAEHRGVIARKTHGKTDHKLYQRFYSAMKPSDVIRLGLRQELLIVAPWVDSLKRDADPDLQDLGKALEKAVLAGQAAVAAHNDAVQTMRDFRAGKRAQLFDEQNGGRRTIWAELSNLGRGGDFVASFFSQGGRRATREELTVEEATARVAGATQGLTAAQRELSAAQERAAAVTAAQSAQLEAQRALAAAEAEAEALARRIAALRHQAQPARA